MRPELVIFDIAGTTVEDGDGVNRCLRESLANAGLPVTSEAVNAVMGRAKPEAIRLLALSAGREDLAARTEAIHANFIDRMRRYYREDPSVRPVAGAEETFRRLEDAGIAVALNTGFSREIVLELLSRLGWESIHSMTSDEVERSRPEPGMIHALMAQLSLEDPERVAKVGDTPADLLEGTNAGCGWVIGVASGTHTAEQLDAFPHTHLIESVRDLPALFGLPETDGETPPAFR